MSLPANAVGVIIELVVYEDGALLAELADAENLKMHFKPPKGGATVEVDAVFSTDGSDAKMRYVTMADDGVNNVGGTWQVQGHFTLDGYTGPTSIGTYAVVENL